MAAPFIRSLHLKQYRSYPRQRHFEFGRMNLISGANGSGKTSLLEAIELLYCGRNKRNPNDTMFYELVAAFSDNQTTIATRDRKPQLFRDRNLSWYGQSEVKTNDLYLSFARFNFLDTDAAVSLSESSSSIEEDLSKLLAGADASKTWRNIERVNEAVLEKLDDLQALENQIKEELRSLEQRLRESSNIKQESDSIHTRLVGMIKRAGWSVGRIEKGELASSMLESLAELESLARQASSLNWIDSPVSIDGLNKYCRKSKVISEKAELDIIHLDLMRKNERRLDDERKRMQKALQWATQAKQYIDAELPARITALGEQRKIIANYSRLLIDFNDKILTVLAGEEQNTVLAKSFDAATRARSEAEILLIGIKNEYSKFSKLRDQSLNLSQQLREIAARILETSPNPDECPLCHTQFAPAQLKSHIKKGIDEHLELLGQSLLTQLRKGEGVVRKTIAVETALEWLKKFSERRCLAVDVSVATSVAEVKNAMLVLTEARGRQEILDKALLSFEAHGLPITKWEEILSRLNELKYPLTEYSRRDADRLLAIINQTLVDLTRSLEDEKKQADEVQRILETTLNLEESTISSLKQAISLLKERASITESLQGKLQDFSSSLPWPIQKPLAELSVEATAIRNVAAELQLAIGRENQAKASFIESTKRKEELVNQLAKLSQRITRLSEAQTTFQTIRNKHSLTGAMKSALQFNHVGIESVFSRIHSPADFRGLGQSLATLIRKIDGKEATLSQISTGQRAAFALSIFLAQNAQLKVAPPVMLIDDPIAHIDDLNSLSFLDYLRDVVLTGRRQIFFSTANDKLATLIERKFDFLGEKDFRRFNLRRER